jgi:hypothetical protein
VCSNGNWPRLGMPMSNDLSWNDAREARLDRAIDRAVREIMQIDPPPGLRRRVLAQLKQRHERPRHLLLQFAVAMTVIALGLVSGTRMWYREELPAPPLAPVVAIGAPATAVAIEAVIQQTTVRDRSATPGQLTRERIAMPRITNVFGNYPRQMSAATVDGMRRDIVAKPLRIVPFSARPIVIEPLVMPTLPVGGGRQ